MTKKTAPLLDTVIEFSCYLSSIRTKVDGGTDFTFSLGKQDIEAQVALLKIKQMEGVVLQVAAVPVKAELLTKVDAPAKKETPKTRDIRRVKQT